MNVGPYRRVWGRWAAVIVLVVTGGAAEAGALKAPFDVEAQREVFGEPILRDYCRSSVDPVIDIVGHKGVANAPPKEAIRAFERNLNDTTDDFVRSKPANAALGDCALEWLAVWARANALLGATDNDGQFIRKWTLAPVAVNYLKVRGVPDLASRTQGIESWFRRWGQVVRDDYSRNTDASSRNNHHLYWAGWGVMAAAIAADDRELFQWSIDVARFAIRQIRKDGSLTWALDSGRKAIYFHALSATALVLLAEGAAANGMDLYAEEGGAVRRLARFTLAALDSPELVASRAGAAQSFVMPPDAEELAWTVPYAVRFPEDVPEKWFRVHKRLDNHLMGGDAILLYARNRTTLAKR